MVADHKSVKRLINTAKGQLEGINKMIDEDAYCIDVSNQLLATIAILKKVNAQILDAHLHHCVKNASDTDLDEKLNEVSFILKKAMK